MKRLAVNFALAALLATFSIPALAQDEKVKEKETKEKESKEKKEVEQIIITRNTDSKEKTVIEINGDKITVNGKPIEDMKDGDVKVHRSKYKTFDGLDAYSLPRARVGGGQNFNWDNGDHFNFFGDVDENRAMLGVVTEEADGNGVKVTDITDESAAKKAGIKEGDIITKINDTKIESPDQLSEVIRKQKPGDKVTVTLLRDKKEQKLTTELGKWKGMSGFMAPGQFKMDMPDYKDMITPKIQGVPRVAWSTNGQPKLGLSVQDTDDGKGVKVLEIDDESNAAKAGLKENDIITHFNDKEVNSADEVAKLVRENKDKVSIKLKINRNGKTENVEVKMPRKLKTADL